MCNSVEVVKKCRSGKCFIGLTHCPHLPDLLSDRQERDFDSSVHALDLTQKILDKILICIGMLQGGQILNCQNTFLRACIFL